MNVLRINDHDQNYSLKESLGIEEFIAYSLLYFV